MVKHMRINQSSFHGKLLNKLGIEDNYVNIMQSRYEKPTANTVLNGEKPRAFPLRSRNKARIPILITSIQHTTGSLSKAVS